MILVPRRLAYNDSGTVVSVLAELLHDNDSVSDEAKLVNVCCGCAF